MTTMTTMTTDATVRCPCGARTAHAGLSMTTCLACYLGTDRATVDRAHEIVMTDDAYIEDYLGAMARAVADLVAIDATTGAAAIE